MLSLVHSAPLSAAALSASRPPRLTQRSAPIQAAAQRDGRIQPGHRGGAAVPCAAQASPQGPRGGATGLDRQAAGLREMKSVQGEPGHSAAAAAAAPRRDMTASDDEWEHMPQQKKWWMELKALLYSWLKTGVEPL